LLKQTIFLKYQTEVNKINFSDIALNGYDAVSYFSEDTPVVGKEQFYYKWKDATWLFSSIENSETFQANPKMFEPQFGGYCSFAVSTGFTADPNPLSYTIIKGKLYLFSEEDIKTDFLADSTIMNKSITNWK
jgi:YHS domain-containing protein